MTRNSNLPPNFLSDHMAKFSGEAYIEGWAGLWNNKGEDERLPWDRGCHSAALEDVLQEKKELVGEAFLTEVPHKSNCRKRALVPGCGTGYDVLLLASFGYDTYGLDYSHVAIETAKKEAAKNADQYAMRDPGVGRGKVVFVQGDFFKDEWLEKLGLGQNSFDLIYDYTFFCALQPYLRPAWALRHRQLLTPPPVGNLICLEWPTTKDPTLRGPPYAAPSHAYLEHLTHPGEETRYQCDGKIEIDPSRKPNDMALERVLHWKPGRTYEIGKDGKTGEVLDRLSIWRRRN
ncbi:hypothetical protein UA08_00611 [Talaromyces atroroseus]|uniref:Thiol methyltransferase 2 n=1 Tax=Talaromyces atroroseus TaxID=1441469 RepID=A0A225AQL7_TALAT|nr:hypothetical protein UA08_00611 [Talaromyces atroroseus]OKL63911.1 hypothetical protein UA08_00611 [Talaromyces atroroseus]